MFICFRSKTGGTGGVHGSSDDELHAKMQGLGRAVAAPRFQFAAARRAPGVLVRAVRVVRATVSPRRRPLDSTSESQSDSRSALSDPAGATTHVSGSARWRRRRAAAFCCFVISLSYSSAERRRGLSTGVNRLGGRRGRSARYQRSMWNPGELNGKTKWCCGLKRNTSVLQAAS